MHLKIQELMRFRMNRNDLKEYFARLKKAQQDEFVGASTNSTRKSLLDERYLRSVSKYIVWNGAGKQLCKSFMRVTSCEAMWYGSNSRN